jgi:ubiquitin-like 1-activating enzyme E1 B
LICRKEALGEKPIKGLEPDKAPEVPRKPRRASTTVNGSANHINGLHPTGAGSATNELKRHRDEEAELPTSAKKARRTSAQDDDDDVVVLADEPGTGAIVIEDD